MFGHAVLRSHDNSEYGAAKHRTVRQGHLPCIVQAGRVFPSADSDPAALLRCSRSSAGTAAGGRVHHGGIHTVPGGIHAQAEGDECTGG